MNQLQMNSDHLPPSSHRFPASASESRSFEDSNPIPLSQWLRVDEPAISSFSPLRRRMTRLWWEERGDERRIHIDGGGGGCNDKTTADESTPDELRPPTSFQPPFSGQREREPKLRRFEPDPTESGLFGNKDTGIPVGNWGFQ
uniref:Uncharacterized protein n=1 Tax=Fagus sylvatica TaxID=28930 RepID=A0A2N9E985_FAGSY